LFWRRAHDVLIIIAETETCEGWLPQGIEQLWDQTEKAWQPCGFSVNAPPSDLKDKFLSIHGAAVEKAKAAGWSGEDELKSD
jgi:hypothetical protein